MNVLSLFDGISCGQIALERAGTKVDNYYAYEIDSFAIAIAKKNYPKTIHLGDINGFNPADIKHPIDLILGGSPCQGFSSAGKQKAFEDPRSRLFFKFAEIVGHYPSAKFLLENVRMKQEYLDIISLILGVPPICINSALVSAQNRVRYYWTNIEGVTIPEDRGIVLKDILEDKNPYSCRMVGRRLDENGTRKDYDHAIPIVQYLEPRLDGKSSCLTTVSKDCLVYLAKPPTSNCPKRPILAGITARQNSYKSNCQVYKVGGKAPIVPTQTSWGHDIKIALDERLYRALTPVECERLQTVPDNYTEGVSKTQRYKCLGNGWTVDVIAHILRACSAR